MSYLTNGYCPLCDRPIECLESDHSVKRHRENQSRVCPTLQWTPAGECDRCDALIETTPAASSLYSRTYRHEDPVLNGEGHSAHPIPRCPSGHRTHTMMGTWGNTTTCENGEYESYYSLGD